VDVHEDGPLIAGGSPERIPPTTARPLGRIPPIIGGPFRRIPPTVALVVLGLLVGAIAALAGAPPITVPSELVLIVLLPGLVFEAAYRLDIAVLRRWIGGIALLAVPGVFVSAVIVTLALHLATGLRLDLAFIVGAIVSATDPAAVVATFKRIRAPRSLATMVDGESLLNDGTGLVLFAIAVGALTTPIGPGDAIVAFVGSVVASLLIGLVAGLGAAAVARAVHHHVAELAISVVLAYGAYLIADLLGQSGVLATVTAAVVLGNLTRHVFTPSGIDTVDRAWEVLAILLTAIVFVVVGLAIPPARMLGSVWPIGVGIVGVLVGRAVVIYVVLGAASRLAPFPGLGGPLPMGWLHVLFWSGLRGAVAVAMALALPEQVPQRELLQEVAFGVVLFTLIVQGLTVGRVVARWIPATE
jgi:monovalent cation:H+ antiporter, CPA1 family